VLFQATEYAKVTAANEDFGMAGFGGLLMGKWRGFDCKK
jgi:hypothetical protein